MTEIKSKEVVKPAPIPITVVTGFLGAGKTTLLNHILTAEHGRRIGVLVNDFGSINVDAELITDVSDEMISLANGCICCTIRMDLIQAVLQLADLPDRPEQIVIESSGVANPAGIVKSFLEPDIWGTVQLDGVITVVDAKQALDLPQEEGRLARAQVAGGDLIMLNKVDLVDAETLARVRAWIDSIRPGIQVFDTIQSRLPMEILLGTGAMVPKQVAAGTDAELGVHVHEVSTTTSAQSHDHDHEHELLFDTWTYTSDAPLQMAMMQQILKHLPSTVFRVKGFVYAIEEPESRMVVQLVGRRATVTPTRTWGTEQPQTRLVFISRHGTVNYPAIEKAMNSCRMVKDENTS
jgi:G3E family GTPase